MMVMCIESNYLLVPKWLRSIRVKSVLVTVRALTMNMQWCVVRSQPCGRSEGRGRQRGVGGVWGSGHHALIAASTPTQQHNDDDEGTQWERQRGWFWGRHDEFGRCQG